MPASYTHNAFGKQVLSNITDEKIKQLITKNINFYNIGLQGPDLLFSYKVLKKIQ